MFKFKNSQKDVKKSFNVSSLLLCLLNIYSEPFCHCYIMIYVWNLIWDPTLMSFCVLMVNTISKFYLGQAAFPLSIFMATSDSRITSSESWTPQENKLFEKALADFDTDAPDRWHHIARAVGGGKTVEDVKLHYQNLVNDLWLIENDSYPIPGSWTTPAPQNTKTKNNNTKGIQICHIII